jgi:MFS family permease
VLGRTVALVSLPIMLGPILGPVLGGVILHWLSWRWLFWVNVPFCVAGFALAWRFLPADEAKPRSKLDVAGLALLAPGIVGVLLGLSDLEGSGPVWLPLLLGLALLAGFILYAFRAGGRALVDVRLLGRQPLASTAAMLALSGVALYGSMLLLPLYWQEVHDASVLTAAFLLVPQGLGNLLSRTVVGRLIDTIGPRWVAFAGFAIVALATAPFAFTDDVWVLSVALVIRGAGLGGVTIPLMAAGFVGLSPAEMPHASIISRIAQQIGGSFGTAVLAVILQRAAERAPLSNAFHQAFWWSIGFTAIAVLLALTLPGRAKADPAVSGVTSRDLAGVAAVEERGPATTT